MAKEIPYMKCNYCDGRDSIIHCNGKHVVLHILWIAFALFATKYIGSKMIVSISFGVILESLISLLYLHKL
jgi:hypothetical protein